jgi:exonuclease III
MNRIPNLTTKISRSNNYLSLISLNINGLNSLIKRHRLTDWLCKQDLTFCCIQETHLSDKDRHYLRIKGWKRIFQPNGPKKQAGVAILISNKINFWHKDIKKDNEGDTSYSSKVIFTKMNFQFLTSMFQIQGHPHSKKKNKNKTFTKAQSTHCTTHNNSSRLQHHTLTNGQIMETETEQRHIETNRSSETNEFNRYI